MRKKSSDARRRTQLLNNFEHSFMSYFNWSIHWEIVSRELIFAISIYGKYRLNNSLIVGYNWKCFHHSILWVESCVIYGVFTNNVNSIPHFDGMFKYDKWIHQLSHLQPVYVHGGQFHLNRNYNRTHYCSGFTMFTLCYYFKHTGSNVLIMFLIQKTDSKLLESWFRAIFLQIQNIMYIIKLHFCSPTSRNFAIICSTFDPGIVSYG